MKTTASSFMYELPAPGPQPLSGNYSLNENFLSQLGFLKLEPAADQKESVYRYYRNKMERGFDLIFCKAFRILTVIEFMTEPDTGEFKYSNMVLGMFHVDSDDDLKFIFSRNVRLNFVFNTSRRKLYGL